MPKQTTKTIDNDLPGGVYTRRIEEELPSIEYLLGGEGEQAEDDLIQAEFFDQLKNQPLVEYVWPNWHHPPNRYPMVSTNASMISGSWAVPLDQAESLMPNTSRLKLLRLSRNTVPLLFIAFQHRRSGFGCYQEIRIGLPVALDAGARPPGLPLILDRVMPGKVGNLGFLIIESPVTMERACTAGIKLYGMPKLISESTFEIAGMSGHAMAEHSGMSMLEFSVTPPGGVKPRVYDLTSQTFSILEDRIIRIRTDCIGEGYRGIRGTGSLKFGDHPRFARLQEMDFGSSPREVRVFPRLNQITWGPEDMGPI